MFLAVQQEVRLLAVKESVCPVWASVGATPWFHRSPPQEQGEFFDSGFSETSVNVEDHKCTGQAPAVLTCPLESVRDV